MRWMVPACVLLLALAPTASAGLNWLLPDKVHAGQPVQGAYAIVESTEPLDLRPHVNVELKVWQDDTLILETASIHEHDGFYPFIITPAAAGTLRLAATTADGTTESTVEVLPASPPDADLAAQMTALGLQVLAAEDSDHILHLDRGEPQVEGDVTGVTPGALTDIRDSDGRVLLSVWNNGLVHVPFRESWRAATGQSLLTGPDHGIAPDRHGLWVQEAALPATEPLRTGLPMLLPSEDATPCMDASLPLVIDPESHSPTALAWEPDTDLRFAVVDLQAAPSASAGATYTLDRLGPDEEGVIFQTAAHDPWGHITFRAPEPGQYRLTVAAADGTCDLDFETLSYTTGPVSHPALQDTVTPAPGSLEVIPSVDGGSVQIQMAAKKADGSANPHHEFDTRVYHAGEDGRLVWKGKLHGHGGSVALTLAGLEGGDYVVQVYPSPQDQADGPVATSDAGGFRYTFSIDGGEPALAEEEPGEEAPGVALLGTLGVLAALVALRRRR